MIAAAPFAVMFAGLAQVQSLPLLVSGWLLVLLVAVAALLGARSASVRQRTLREVRAGELDLLRESILRVREERRVHQEQAAGWSGFANFVVAKKQLHGDSGICSFYLRPHNPHLRLTTFFPGQHLVFQVPSKQGGSPLTRRYSLSDAPGRDCYRISVKLAQPPPSEPPVPIGRGSSWFHQQLLAESEDPGRCHLLVAAPQGSFHLNPLESEALVLIAGGVGVTPILSMFASIVEQNPQREVWFFYGVRNSGEDILFDPGVLPAGTAELCAERPNLHLRIRYSQPLERDKPLLEDRPDLYTRGRVGMDFLREQLPSCNFRFFICGPDVMMDQLEQGLISWAVPEEHIHSERFGPPPVRARPGNPGEPAVECFVQFAKSGKSVAFADDDNCLLAAAERAGVPISNDCRAGTCGECKTALLEGEVVYPRKTSFKCPPGYCLTCSCLPKGPVTLDC